MRRNLRADAVFQRRDDFSTSRVIFRVRRENEHHVERQTHRKTFNLHVAFLHYVEKSDLNLSRQIGKFVDRKNSAIRPRQKSVKNRQFIRQKMSAFRRFNRVNIAYNVGNRHVRRGEFFDKARIAFHPGDFSFVTFLRDNLFAVSRQRFERIIADFRTGDDRDFFVEKFGQLSDNSTFRLSACAEQNQIMLRQNRIDELRNYRFFVTDDALEKLLARL